MNLILSTVIIAILLSASSTTIFSNDILYAHNFSITDDSSLVTLVEEIKAGTRLVDINFLNDNNLTLIHARAVAQLINELEDNMTKGSSSNIAQIYDNVQRNSTTLAMVMANVVDQILREYGRAFDISYDLTNMSNMNSMMPGMANTSLSINIPSTAVTNPSSGNISERRFNTSMIMMQNNYVLTSISDFETAQGLKERVNTLFYDQLLPRSPLNNEAAIDELEEGLKNLNNVINARGSPEVLMQIVHLQIHPMLQKIYDLKLLRGNT